MWQEENEENEHTSANEGKNKRYWRSFARNDSYYFDERKRCVERKDNSGLVCVDARRYTKVTNEDCNPLGTQMLL